VVLAVLSLAGGWVLHNNHLLQHWLYPDGLRFLSDEQVHLHPTTGWFAGKDLPLGNFMFVGIAVGILGILYGLFVYRNGLPKKEREEANWSPLRRWFGNQMGYDKAMVDAAVEGGGMLGNFTWKQVDSEGIDGLVNGVAAGVGGLGALLRKVQSGLVRGYALMMLLGGLGIFAYLAWLLSKGGAN